jgi:hypothetical protein
VVGGFVVSCIIFIVKHWARITGLRKLGERLLVVGHDIDALNKALEELKKDTHDKIVQSQDAAHASIDLRLRVLGNRVGALYVGRTIFSSTAHWASRPGLTISRGIPGRLGI